MLQESGQFELASPVKRGGPESTYTDELAEEICRRLAAGESLRSICEDEGMPDRGTVLRWQEGRPQFAAAFARARTILADVLDDDIQIIADNATPQTANLAKMRVGVMQWRMSKMNARRYGDRLDTTTTHEVGDSLMQLLSQVAQTPRGVEALTIDAEPAQTAAGPPISSSAPLPASHAPSPAAGVPSPADQAPSRAYIEESSVAVVVAVERLRTADDEANDG